MKESLKRKRPGHLERAANAGKEELLNTAEFFSSLPEMASVPIRYLLKKFGPEKVSKMLSELEKTSDQYEGQLPAVGKKTGFTKELPQAETYGEKISENLGRAGGALLTGSPLKALSTVPRAAATLGGLGTQSLLQPKIEEALPNSPILQMGANFITGLGGSLAGGITGNKLKKKNTEIPKGTAGQLAELGSEESDRLLAKQLDLTKKDYKSAKELQKIQDAQHEGISKKLSSNNTIKGSEVVDDILTSFENVKEQGRKEYEEGLGTIMQGMENTSKFDPLTGQKLGRYKKIEAFEALDRLQELYHTSAKNGETQSFIRKLKKQILRQHGDPLKLDALKKEWSSKANYGSNNPLYVGKPKQAVFNKVIHALTEDLKEQVPGYREFMETTAANIEKRNSFIDGVVGEYVKSGEKKPSQLIKKIFEKTDPEHVHVLKSSISPEIYDKAAQTYVNDVLHEGLATPSLNQQNKFNQYAKVREEFEKNLPNLEHTLPEPYKNLVNESISDIKLSERGVPRGDYTINTNRNIAVGDETKGLGVVKGAFGKSVPSLIGSGAGYLLGGIPGAALGAATAEGGKRIGQGIKTKLLRNEMLTGVSPGKQIGKAIGNVGRQGVQQSILSSNLSKTKNPIEENSKEELNKREEIAPVQIVSENEKPVSTIRPSFSEYISTPRETEKMVVETTEQNKRPSFSEYIKSR